ncbi:MAG: hypothetical protein WB443_15535 [Nitrososphaeraceae archaeon]
MITAALKEKFASGKLVHILLYSELKPDDNTDNNTIAEKIRGISCSNYFRW